MKEVFVKNYDGGSKVTVCTIKLVSSKSKGGMALEVMGFQ